MEFSFKVKNVIILGVRLFDRFYLEKITVRPNLFSDALK